MGARLAALLVPVVLVGPTPAAGRSAPPEGVIRVFAAASLTEAVTETARVCQARLGERPVLHFAGSSTLAQQIRAGAPADVFFSAHPGRMEELVRAGLMRAGDVRTPVSNALVVVVSRDAIDVPRAASDLRRLARLALADPDAVPAGIYAREFLEAEGLWRELRGRVVPTLDVRAALAAVEAGHVPAAIVYSTDAAQSGRVRTAFEVRGPSAPDVTYALAPLTGSPRGAAWAGCLGSEESLAVYRRFGFLTPARP